LTSDSERANELGLTLLSQEESNILSELTFISLNNLRKANGILPLQQDANLCAISSQLSGSVTRWADESQLGLIDTTSQTFKTLADNLKIFVTHKNIKIYSLGAISRSTSSANVAEKWFSGKKSELLSSNRGTHGCIRGNPNVMILTVGGN
jgi:hypothetical protein